MHRRKSNRWLERSAAQHKWGGGILYPTCMTSVSLCVLFSLFWQNPTQPRKNCKACRINSFPLMTPEGQNAVGRCSEELRLLCCTRALQSARRVCHEASTDTHTPLPSGWLVRDRLPHYLYRQVYFTILHNSTDKTHADKFHVFGLPRVTPASPYLCTQHSHAAK